MIRRTFRLHQNGRTLLSWWRTYEDSPVFPPVTRDPARQLQIRFDDTPPEAPEAMVLLDGALMYRFTEQVFSPPFNGFHKVEFVFDNDLWAIEYRREPD